MAQNSGSDREPLLVEHEKAKETTADLLDFEPLSAFHRRRRGRSVQSRKGKGKEKQT